ncbi:hypothetical protein B0H19DRAFT_1269294 [Mycena capillaripes]|nr:hypothetical protein B0H19DRAFT_1269294 [Mycena capillaripes]
MQFNLVFIATALLVSASPAIAGSGQCIFFTNGGSAKSFGYSGVPNQIPFFESGGAHDICSNGAFLMLGGGSGCGTASDGFNVESVFLS